MIGLLCLLMGGQQLREVSQGVLTYGDISTAPERHGHKADEELRVPRTQGTKTGASPAESP